MKKVIIAILGIFFIFISIQGCNTVKGVGKDIQKTGEAIQRTVK